MAFPGLCIRIDIFEGNATLISRTVGKRIIRKYKKEKCKELRRKISKVVEKEERRIKLIQRMSGLYRTRQLSQTSNLTEMLL